MNALVAQMAKNVLWKFDRDTKPLLERNFEDEEIYPWTNRTQESVFAQMKSLMKRFITMSADKPLVLTQSKVNKLGDFVYELVNNRYIQFLFLILPFLRSPRNGHNCCKKAKMREPKND